jgi:hypothetical protein
MSGKKREWTAEINGTNGHPKIWAWMAYNDKLGTFGTGNPEHARLFTSKADVEAWIARLKIKDAKAVRLKT